MATINVPTKTPEALAELTSRQRKLSQRHRTVLLLVDGRRDEHEVRQMAIAAGSPDTAFDELMDLGMISRPAPLEPEPRSSRKSSSSSVLIESQPVPLDAAPSASMPLGPDSVVSVLPPSLSLHSESHLDSLNELPHAAPEALESEPFDVQDEALEEARAILLRAVRAEAPVAGSLTILRLRRARTREDIESLLEEVESRIFKPFKGLWASQTMARVRELLSTHPSLSLPSS
ncbi:MAG TPA: hypothetical protein VFL64_07280 [Rhizobacter sp.]|nr:hypothetical protein [Rhizobacter sp.]